MRIGSNATSTFGSGFKRKNGRIWGVGMFQQKAGITKSMSVKAVHHGPLLQARSNRMSTTSGSRGVHTQRHVGIGVNTDKAKLIGGAAVAGYAAHKIYRHYHPKQPKALRQYHQSHAGVPQEATFHQTHMMLGSRPSYGGYY